MEKMHVITCLPGKEKRAQLMRYDTATILRRLFFCEKSLLLSQAAWIAAIGPLEIKNTLAKMVWQNALSADALRCRFFELRFPSRFLEIGNDAPLIHLLDDIRHSPNAYAFVQAYAEVALPMLRAAYRHYRELADELGDGPSLRFLGQAISDKEEQISILKTLYPLLGCDAEDSMAKGWVTALQKKMDALGGIQMDPPGPEPQSLRDHKGYRSYQRPQQPTRDSRFHQVRFYWPDIVDSNCPYGEGMELQLRSAVSHLNEVWAVEACGLNLAAFAELLGWDFVRDGARWLYDESRHCRMGQERLLAWGFTNEDLPLGTFIYDAITRDEDPLVGLGMLYFFETKNIGRKTERARQFASMHDAMSQHDMDFDWADETIHASYGKKWISKALELRNKNMTLDDLRTQCQQLVAQVIQAAGAEETDTIHQIRKALLVKAQRLIR